MDLKADYTQQKTGFLNSNSNLYKIFKLKHTHTHKNRTRKDVGHCQVVQYLERKK